MTSNLVTALPPAGFSEMRALRYMFAIGCTHCCLTSGGSDMDSNLVKSFPEHAFAGLANLTELWFYGNKITILAPSIFEGLRSLQLL